MPSSRYVQLEVNNKQAVAGELNRSRRSQRIRSKSRTRARSIDPDETVLNDQTTTVDESGYLLAEDDFPSMEKKSDINAMDVDENDVKTRSHSSPPSLRRRKGAGPISMRGGAKEKGYLTNDPLTSSTMKSTPFSVVRRRNAKKNAEKDKSRSKISERFDSSDDESTQNNDDDIANNIDEQEFLREVARKRAQREETLLVRDESTTTKAYAPGFNPPDGEQQEKRQHTSFDESFASRQQQSSHQNESDLVTARIANNNSSSSSNSNLSETLAATQPWENELDGLPFFQGNTLNQNHIHQPNQSFIAPPKISVGQQLHADYDSQFDSQLNQSANNEASTKQFQSSSVSFAADTQQKSTTDSQPNIQWGRSRRQEESVPTNDSRHCGESIQQNNQSGISSFGNSNLRNLPPQPPPFDKATAPIVPRISLANLGNMGRGDDNMNKIMSSKCGEGDTWREEAFRSSLLDLLASFPTNFFDIKEEDRRMIYAIANVDEESPHSTAQKAASSQLNHKRLFDAASRSLARLAIASRRTTKTVDSMSGRRADEFRDDGESPDFNPPSPRSLPAYMSVLNVCDDSNPGRSRHWQQAGNANNTEVFTGQSVHGRNARTLRLSKKGNIIRSSNPFSSWSSNELVYGASVLAAQVVHEASRDNTTQYESSKHRGDIKRPAVLSTLVESCLGFLATTFACLESDFVYSVLKSTLRSDITVFDALSHLSPVTLQDGTLNEADTVSSLALLALSRGLDAAVTVARLTSLDPSSACMAYSPPHKCCNTNINVYDHGINSNGVGWNSALGRDLGLKLEDYLDSRPRYMHLNDIAMYAYDIILDYNPMSIDRGIPRRDDRDATKRGKSRGSHYIDTQDGRRQTMDTVECSQPSVMKDRLYAATVEYLSSMIRAGIVSGWLTNSLVSAHATGDSNNSICGRTMDKLCQKLFFVIETVARRRRSTNQISGSPDSGDSEAVCAASLTLLVLALPESVSQSEPTSLSTSFRQMGTSTGSLDDLLQSPLVRNMIELALTWQDPRSSRGSNKENDNITKNHAASNAMYILGDVCMAGGSFLICQDFSQRVGQFLQAITNSICERGRTSNFDSALLLVLQLHIRSPIMIRTFLRNFMESNDDSASSFVGGLMRLASDDSFAVSSCASSLLLALVEGNPADRTEDKLSDMILNSLGTDQVGSVLKDMIYLILESAHTSLNCNIPHFSIYFHPSMCSLGDLLCAFIRTNSASEIFASFISDNVLNLFAEISEYGEKHNCSSDALSASAKMSIVSLFASFATSTASTKDMIAQQRQVREKLISSPGYLTLLEAAMSQGNSVDSTRRALKLQSSLLSLTDERFLAHTLTNSRNSARRKEINLRDKVATYQSEMRKMDEKCRQIELNRDVLTDSLRDQRLSYDRQLEWTRAEYQMASRNVSEIFAYERRQAEEQYSEEREARIRIERENEQLTHDCSSYKFRIDKLDELLQLERKARQSMESEFGTCKNELSRTSNVCNDLQEKLSASEVKVSNLTAINEESESTMEEICSKLIKLSTIYQVKEQEMDKYKAELRSAVNTANRHADTAIEKYESANRENKLLNERLKEVTAELSEIKTRKADVQRMRKNAPVAYLNQLHRDPTIPQRITLQDAGQRRSPMRQGNSKTQN